MHHTLSVLVEDKAGVLARVSSLLARRGFNIHSLAVGPSVESGMSRMTIVVEAPELEQVKKQLHKLINVVKITELDADRSVEREIMLIRISTASGVRSDVLEIGAIFKATVVDVGQNAVTFQVTGTPAKLADFFELVRPYGVVDMAKSGRIALSRENRARKLKAVGQ